MRRAVVAAALLSATLGLLTLLPASPAAAHPLGNFSVNQYVGLTVRPDRVDALVIVDLAEIPTLQDRPAVDADGSGVISDAERLSYAGQRCMAVAAGLVTSAGPEPLVWTVASSTLDYAAGTGGLEVSRLACRLTVPPSVAADHLARGELAVENRYLADRIGWREMTAVGLGVRLVNSPLPTVSRTGELRAYPDDPLAPPLDVRSAALLFVPDAAMWSGGSGGSGSGGSGSGDSGATAPGSARSASGDSGATAPGGARSGSDPASRWMAAVEGRFQQLAGGAFTPLVVLLTAGLAILLGAGHAALPGHGKTVLAAYLAGRRGRRRDAVIVAGTVTLTHTAGVVVLGLLISAGAAFAGEHILAWLGLTSGLIVCVVGAAMLVRLVRRRGPSHRHGPGPRHDPGDHRHGPGHPHHHHHSHTHGSHSHGSHTHGRHTHGHSHGSGDGSGDGGSRRGRVGLAGLGVAGGLVPSPSALVVLLAAIGLGRTGYGIVLVMLYGAGMAITLTAAGLLLLAVQRRIARRGASEGITTWLSRIAGRLGAATPVATAALVVLVGVGLAARAGAAIV